ncbi:MAG: hypothetical protein GY830_03980 [Bacteroidetes bacterium]|nr:hypothetical protein [Bacteroidota bacterium]
MGLITIQDAIAQARKIEPAAAEVEYQKIKKQKEEQQEKQKELINDTQEKLPQEEEIDNAKNG